MLSSHDYKHANEIYTNRNGNILWLGDFSAADDRQWLKSEKIKTVITAASGLRLAYDRTIQHFCYSLEDKKSENISQYFDQVNDRIDQGLRIGSVLVHCGAGVSRSATFVIAYLMKNLNKTFHEALSYTKQKRPVICPNLGFELQLKKYRVPFNTTQYPKHRHIEHPDQPPSNIDKKFTTSFYTSKAQKIQSFPEIIKPQNFEFITGENKNMPKGWKQRKIGEKKFMTKSLINQSIEKDKNKFKSELKKIAQFRFGMTNMSKWGFY